MKYLTFKLRKLVRTVLIWETEKLLFKYLYKNIRLPYFIRQKSFHLLDKFALNTTFIRLRRRCLMTNTPHYVFKYLKISRRVIHQIVRQTGWCGLKTSSW